MWGEPSPHTPWAGEWQAIQGGYDDMLLWQRGASQKPAPREPPDFAVRRQRCFS